MSNQSAIQSTATPTSALPSPLALQPQSGATPSTAFEVPQSAPQPVLPQPTAPKPVQRVPETSPKTVENVPAPGPAARQVASSSKPATVREAIADAARRSSVDYEYLVAQAELESGLNPRAKARTSTATGLFQFLETTWLSTVKKHGPRFGYADIANQIQTFSNGRPFVPDRGQRNAILALRNDPQIASLMAAGFAEDNRAALIPVLGRQPGHAELYMAHFLGAGGARKFLTALQQNPNQSAASVFPRAAAANRPIFYDRNGSARSLAGVMDLMASKMNRALARVDSGNMGRRANASYTPMAVPSTSPARTSASAGLGTPPPYVIADEDVFAPANPPVITGGNRPRTAPVASLTTPAARANAPRPAPSSLSMSSMLRATFGGDGGPALASPEGAAQVKRAYDQLKAFGL